MGSSSEIFGNVRKLSEHDQESSGMFGSHREFFGKPGNMDSKITRI